MFFSRAPRFPVQFTAVYDDGERYLTAPVTNLSGSGLFIETTAPVKEGAKVHIVPLLPPSRGLPELEGVVVRIQNGAAELGRTQPAGMGIRFVALGEGDAELLKAFCENLKRGTDKHEAVPAKAAHKPREVAAPASVSAYRGLSLKTPAVPAPSPEPQSATSAAKAEASPSSSTHTHDAPNKASAGARSAGAIEPAAGTSPDAASASTPMAPSAEVPAATVVAPAPVEVLSAGSTPPTPSDEPGSAAPSHAEEKTTTGLSDEDAMPLMADDDAELLATGETARLPQPASPAAEAAEPLLLERTKTEPVLLDRRKDSAESQASTQAADEIEAQPVDDDTTVQEVAAGNRPAAAATPAPATQSLKPAAEDTPDEVTERVRERGDPGVAVLEASTTAWNISADAQPYAALVEEHADADLTGIVAPRGQGLLIALALINLALIGVGLFLGMDRFRAVDQRLSTAEVRASNLNQDVGFVAQRVKDVERTQGTQGAKLDAVAGVTLTGPALLQAVTATPAGAPGRFLVQSQTTLTNASADDSEVVYLTRRMFVGDVAGLPTALGTVQPLNAVGDKGGVAWKELSVEQHLSDGEKLAAFKGLSKAERTTLTKGAALGDVVGPLTAGASRTDARQALIDLPQGGVITVVTEVGVLVDDAPVTLTERTTTALPAVTAVP